MTNRLRLSVAATLLALGIAPLTNVASAMPRADALALSNPAPTNVETVRYRARGWHGGGVYRGRAWRGRGWHGRGGWYGPGWGWGAGLVGGAIVGSMLAAPYYYGPGYYAEPGYYYAPGPYRRCWVRTDPDRPYGYWAPCR